MAVKPLKEQGIDVETIIAKYDNTTAWGRIVTRCGSRDVQERSYFEDRLVAKETSTENDALMLEEVLDLVYNYEEPTEPTEDMEEI